MKRTLRNRFMYAAWVVMAAVLAAGCESLEQVILVTAEVLEDNIELVDEEDRDKVLVSVRSVRAMLEEIDTSEEIAIGQSLAVRTFGAFGPPCRDASVTRYVAKVGKTVALQSERPSLPFSFAVVASDTPNALALPGGYVFVSTGLLKKLKSEYELAAILGHEIAHVAQRHGLEIILRDRRISSLVDVAAEFDEEVAENRQFIDLSYQKLAHEG